MTNGRGPGQSTWVPDVFHHQCNANKGNLGLRARRCDHDAGDHGWWIFLRSLLLTSGKQRAAEKGRMMSDAGVMSRAKPVVSGGDPLQSSFSLPWPAMFFCVPLLCCLIVTSFKDYWTSPEGGHFSRCRSGGRGSVEICLVRRLLGSILRRIAQGFWNSVVILVPSLNRVHSPVSMIHGLCALQYGTSVAGPFLFFCFFHRFRAVSKSSLYPLIRHGQMGI